MGRVGQFVAGVGLIAGSFLAPGLGGFFVGRFGTTLLGLSKVAGLSLLNASLGRRPPLGREATEARFQGSSPDQPERFVFGETEIAIAPVFWDIDPDDASKLLIIGSICVGSRDGGGIEGVTRVRFNGIERMSPVAPAETLLAQRLGLTSGGAEEGDHAAFIRYGLHLGAADQIADLETHLTYESWTEEHRGRGVAYIILELKSDTEAGKFTDGIPNIVVGVRGSRCFDPRDSTWKWTKNAILAAREYLLHPQGYGLDESQLDDTLIGAAANVCDSDPGNGRGAPMFECNGWFYQASTPAGRWENLNRILASCRGYLTFQDGKYGIRISQADAASGIQFTDDDLSGKIEVVLPGSQRKPNRATARYVIPGADYQVAEVTVPDAFGVGNAFLTEDNDVESGLEIDLPMVTDRRQAEDIAFVSLKEARSALVRWETKERGLLATVGDIVELSSEAYGWTEKPIRIAAIETFADSNRVRLTGLIHEADAYDLDPNSTVPGLPDTDLPDPDFVDPPENVQLVCNAGIFLPDGTFQPRLHVTWEASPAAFLERYEIAYRTADTGSGPGPWLERPSVPKGSDLEAFIDQVVVGETYEVRVTAVNSISVHSVPVVTASCVVGNPDTTPETIDNLTGQFTCLEGITLKWDPPVVGPANGVDKFVWHTEIRKAGAGSTPEERWQNGTFIEDRLGGRFNWSFDEVFADDPDSSSRTLVLKRQDMFGNYAPVDAIEITVTNLSWPCEDFGEGGGPAQCPNLAPFDAAVPNRTQQAQGTVLGTPYDLVPIDTTGITPGRDRISYCYQARVGPSEDVDGGDTGTSDGKMIRLREGLLGQIQASQQGNIKLRRGNVYRVTKDGQQVYEVRQDSVGYSWAALVDPRLGLDADGEINAQGEQHTRLWMQAYLQYEGTSSPFIGGTSRTLCANHVGDRYKHPYHMTSPFVGFTNDPEGDVGSGYWYLYTSKRGFFSGQFESWLVRHPGLLKVSGRGSKTISCDNPLHFHIEGNRMIAMAAGKAAWFQKDPITSTDAVETGPWYPMFGLWNDPDFTEIGRSWNPQMDVCRDQIVRINSVGPANPFGGTNHVALVNQHGQRARAYSFSGGAELVWAAWRNNIDSFYGKEAQTKVGISTPEYKFRWPANKIEIWSGQPGGGGSLVDEVDVPIGIWPGDVWDYHSDGAGEPGGEFPNASVTLLLEFLDAAQNVISTIEPPTVSNIAYEAVSSVDHVVPLGTAFFRFTPKKTGTANAWGETDDLQFNRGEICCEFSDPRVAPVDRTLDLVLDDCGCVDDTDVAIGTDGKSHVTQLYGETNEQLITGDEIIDALAEQGQSAVNLLEQSNEERFTPSAAGEQTGEPWPLLDLDAVGIDEGATLSIRVEARTEV